MMSVYDCPTKKELKARVNEPANFILQETSLFGPEYKGDGKYCVVGPSPYVRKWYATVLVKEGKIAKVS